MKKLTLLTLIAGLAGSIAAHGAFPGPFDGEVRIDPTPSGAGGANGGGAFLATVVSGLGNVVSDPGGSFLTFCIERNEYISFPSNPANRVYDVNLANSSSRGGIAGGSPDPISLATAWLYSKFRDGSLIGVGGFTGNSASHSALQNAIWYLEQELGVSGAPAFSTAATSLVQAAIDDLGLTWANVQSTPANGEFNVRVMRLYNGPSADAEGYNQDMLAIVPEPSTYIAGGLALLPLLFGLRARWQKK
ncbi:MAG: hypothetical protein KF833_03630 [Verrucomicrobiae bacterium]|nr:hypothetical protein [Verrucomicrobiae bacterium]